MAFDANKYQNGYRHKLKTETEKLYAELKVHIDGEYPVKLIDERRPSEPVHIKTYRKLIFQHIGNPTINKALESVGRIRKSHDYDIKFIDENQPARIRKGEGLKEYTFKKFPFFDSLTNWAFSVCLKQQAVDANALCLVMPLEKEWEFKAGQYIKPYPYIYNSDQVMDFVPGEYMVVRSTDTSKYFMGNIEYRDGEVYYYADKMIIQRWEKKDNGKFDMTGQFIHGKNKLPSWKIGGVVKKTYDGDFLMSSRFAPMLPYLNEAVREYSDLQAGVVQHLFLESWALSTQTCGACKGVGREMVDDNWIKCRNQNCSAGLIIPSPYETMTIGKGKDGAFPEPPFKGYVDKDPKIIEIQDERIDRHKFNALAAINMEFLAQTPLNQSGTAKEVDRDEVNNFVYGNAEDLVRNMDNVMFWVNEMRYSVIVPDDEERLNMLPTIPVPQKFDILSSNILIEGIGKMRESKINPILINEAEKVFAGKEFNSDPEVRSKLELILSLDPLSGRSEDDKMMMKNNGGITPEKYIISSNIIEFVTRAMEEHNNFTVIDRKKQMEIITKYAAEIEKSLSSLEQVMPDDKYDPR